MYRYRSRKSNKNEQIQPSTRRSVRERTVKFIETTVQEDISPKGKVHRLKSMGHIDNNDLAFNVQTEKVIENDNINSNEINSSNIKRRPRKFTSSFKRKPTNKNHNISIKEENSKLLIERISPLKFENIKDAKQRRLQRKNTKTNNIWDDDDDNNNNNEIKNENKIDENNHMDHIDVRRDKRFKRLKTKDYRTKKDYKEKHENNDEKKEEKKEEKADETESSNSNELQVTSRYVKNNFTKGRLVGDSSDKLIKVEMPPKQNEEENKENKEMRKTLFRRSRNIENIAIKEDIQTSTNKKNEEIKEKEQNLLNDYNNKNNEENQINKRRRYGRYSSAEKLKSKEDNIFT